MRVVKVYSWYDETDYDIVLCKESIVVDLLTNTDKSLAIGINIFSHPQKFLGLVETKGC